MIHVVDLGWHTDLALPPDEVPVPVPVPEGTRSVLVGFGARGWYMAEAPGFREGARALLGDRGAVLVWPLPEPPRARFGPDRVVSLGVSPEGMAGLRDFLGRTLPPAPVRLGDGPYPGSAFYATEVRYSLAYTCNTWVVDALRAAGLPARLRGVVTAGQAMRQARRLEAGQRGDQGATSGPLGAPQPVAPQPVAAR